MQWGGLEAFRKGSGPKPSKSKKHVANHVCDRWAQQEILTGRLCLSGTESLGTTSFIHLRMYMCNLYRTLACILYKLYDVQYTCCTFMLYIFFSYTSAPRAEGGCKHTPNTSLRSLTERKNNKWTTYNIYITNTYNLQSKDTALCTTGTICKNFHAFLLECRFQMEATQDEVVTARGLGERVVSWNVGRSWPTAGVGPDRIGNHKCQVVAVTVQMNLSAFARFQCFKAYIIQSGKIPAIS